MHRNAWLWVETAVYLRLSVAELSLAVLIVAGVLCLHRRVQLCALSLAAAAFDYLHLSSEPVRRRPAAVSNQEILYTALLRA